MRSIKPIRLTAVTLLATLVTSASADERAVRATLAATFPQTVVQGIAETPFAGLFEAAIDGRVYYVSSDGRYILGGPLFDTKTGVNLTETRLAKIDAIPWDSLPLDLAIKRVKGAGTRRIAIFEDPDCPYCKALEKTLGDMDDVTVYVLLFPIAALHPQATDKSKAIWCAKDRGKAWDEAVRTGVAPADSGSCDNPIAKLAAFARQHRITGTPTSILANGRRVVGALPRAELERQMLLAARSN